MKAEDTVMDADQVVANVIELFAEAIKEGFDLNMPKEEAVVRLVKKEIEAQAEISFKLGMREVVEWIPELIEAIKKEMWTDDWGIEHSVIYPDMLDRFVEKRTKAKLKKWEIK